MIVRLSESEDKNMETHNNSLICYDLFPILNNKLHLKDCYAKIMLHKFIAYIIMKFTIHIIHFVHSKNHHRFNAVRIA